MKRDVRIERFSWAGIAIAIPAGLMCLGMIFGGAYLIFNHERTLAIEKAKIEAQELKRDRELARTLQIARETRERAEEDAKARQAAEAAQRATEAQEKAKHDLDMEMRKQDHERALERLRIEKAKAVEQVEEKIAAIQERQARARKADEAEMIERRKATELRNKIVRYCNVTFSKSCRNFSVYGKPVDVLGLDGNPGKLWHVAFLRQVVDQQLNRYRSQPAKGWVLTQDDEVVSWQSDAPLERVTIAKAR